MYQSFHIFKINEYLMAETLLPVQYCEQSVYHLAMLDLKYVPPHHVGFVKLFGQVHQQLLKSRLDVEFLHSQSVPTNLQHFSGLVLRISRM